MRALIQIFISFLISLIVLGCSVDPTGTNNDNSEFSIVYNGNGKTSGTIPTDNKVYKTGNIANILENTGNLAKNGFYFDGWNTQTNGSGQDYVPGSTIEVSKTLILYAKWSTYKIGDTGPAGGLIFYIKSSYSDGWRYLEAAPSDQSFSSSWYSNTSNYLGNTDTNLGSGLMNTANLVVTFGSGSYAANICNDYNIGSYSDWYLPSLDELKYMHTNLKFAGLGNFSETWYWSSSESSSSHAYSYEFWAGEAYYTVKTVNYRVRAIRRF